MKNYKGITLIALIITIIVMLILAAVTINIAINGGLFEYAEKSATDTKLAKLEEKLWQEYMTLKMNDYANGTNNASFDTAVDTINEKGEYNIVKIPEGGITDIILSSDNIIIGIDDNTKTEMITVDFEGEEGAYQYYAVIGEYTYKIDYNNDGKVIIEKEPSEISGGEAIETNELSITLANSSLATTSIEGNQITIIGSKATGETTFTVSYGNIEKNGTLVAKNIIERSLDGAMWLGSNFTIGTTITNVTTSNSNIAQVVQLSDNTYSLVCGNTEGVAEATVTTASETLDFKIQSTAKIVYPTNGATNTANTTITGATTGYGTNNPIIPRGFYAINTKDAKWVDNNGNSVASSNVNKGLTIMDTNGNQFVWVPIIITETDTPPNDSNQTCVIAAMERTNWSTSDGSTSAPNSSYKEPYTSGYTTEKADWYDMMKSVYNFGGFYVGRFETGSTTIRASGSFGTCNTIIQQDSYPYRSLGWGTAMNNIEDAITVTSGGNTTNYGNGAACLGKNMYNSTSYGAKSSLIYGSQWDAILKWIDSEDYQVWASTIWGNYKNNNQTILKRGAYDSSYTPIRSAYANKKEKVLTTGASDDFKSKNIYDMAGNMQEWTMEGYRSGNNTSRTLRGGYYNLNYSIPDAASHRGLRKPDEIASFFGFRVSLFVVN